MYQIKNLAGNLDFPEAVIEQMMLEIESISSEMLEQYSRELLDANKAKAAAKKIDEVYEEEPFVALTIYLYAASQSWLWWVTKCKRDRRNGCCFYGWRNI